LDIAAQGASPGALFCLRAGEETVKTVSKQQLTQEAFDRIQGTMTLAEVEAILGRPGERNRPTHFPEPLCALGDEVEEWYWSEGDVAIAVVFDRKTRRVEAAEWSGPPSPGDPIRGSKW
jgi:hypothetical protein